MQRLVMVLVGQQRLVQAGAQAPVLVQRLMLGQ